MHDFRIIEEQTLEYHNSEQLWLMIIRLDDHYGIELNSRNAMVGRKFARSRREAEAMYNHIAIKLNKCLDINTAWDLMDVAFALPSVKSMMFFVNTRFREYDFNSLCKLKRFYGYTTIPRIEDCIFEQKHMDKTIQVVFPEADIPIAKFVAVDNEDEFTKFRVELCIQYCTG